MPQLSDQTPKMQNKESKCNQLNKYLNNVRKFILVEGIGYVATLHRDETDGTSPTKYTFVLLAVLLGNMGIIWHKGINRDGGTM